MAQFNPADPELFVDRLEGLIRTYVLDVMPGGSVSEIQRLPVSELILGFSNWRSRFVHPHPRTVHLSSQLRSSATNLSEYRSALDSIANDLKSGREVTPHLSRGVMTGPVPQNQQNARLNRRKDLDLLLSDWNLHHLHLSTELESDGFVLRTEDLLFAAISETDAYLIGIYPHGSWASRELIEVLVREWPSNTVVQGSLSEIRLSQSFDETEHLQLRNAGLTTLIEVGGTIVMPGLGMTTAGTSIMVADRANSRMRALDSLREDLDGWLTTLDDDHPAPQGTPVTWEPWMEDDTWGVRRGSLFYPIADLW